MTSSASAAAGVTQLLEAWRAGDTAAPDALAGLVYGELRAMAARRLAGAWPRPLETTELVHEAFSRLLEKPLQAEGRSHFFRIAALALRQALVDAIRRDQADKRGGGMLNLSLGAAANLPVAGPESWLVVETALAELERQDERKCRVVELCFLLGLTNAEAAEVLSVSVPTVERDLRFARVWLADRLAS